MAALPPVGRGIHAPFLTTMESPDLVKKSFRRSVRENPVAPLSFAKPTPQYDAHNRKSEEYAKPDLVSPAGFANPWGLLHAPGAT